jgi:ATP synthase protein I
MSDDAGRRVDRDFSDQVHTREKRKLRARKHKKDEFWFGLGMFGMVGWSVAIPTVIGIFVGVWIDITWPSRYSWALMLLVVGLILGCANAWFWVNRERKAIGQERENDAD